jgi:hypothetical protein
MKATALFVAIALGAWMTVAEARGGTITAAAITHRVTVDIIRVGPVPPTGAVPTTDRMADTVGTNKKSRPSLRIARTDGMRISLT